MKNCSPSQSPHRLSYTRVLYCIIRTHIHTLTCTYTLYHNKCVLFFFSLLFALQPPRRSSLPVRGAISCCNALSAGIPQRIHSSWEIARPQQHLFTTLCPGVYFFLTNQYYHSFPYEVESRTNTRTQSIVQIVDECNLNQSLAVTIIFI